MEHLIIVILFSQILQLSRLHDLSVILLLLGIYNFPIVSQTQDEYDNTSVFEESDNEDGMFNFLMKTQAMIPLKLTYNSVF